MANVIMYLMTTLYNYFEVFFNQVFSKNLVSQMSSLLFPLAEVFLLLPCVIYFPFFLKNKFFFIF